MTNSEKFKTAEERARAFEKYCALLTCKQCEVCRKKLNHSVYTCLAFWLDLEAEEEKPLPRPFCGNDVRPYDFDGITYACECGYRSQVKSLIGEAIAAHNRLARSLIDAMKREETP